MSNIPPTSDNICEIWKTYYFFLRIRIVWIIVILRWRSTHYWLAMVAYSTHAHSWNFQHCDVVVFRNVRTQHEEGKFYRDTRNCFVRFSLHLKQKRFLETLFFKLASSYNFEVTLLQIKVYTFLLFFVLNILCWSIVVQIKDRISHHSVYMVAEKRNREEKDMNAAFHQNKLCFLHRIFQATSISDKSRLQYVKFYTANF